MLSIATVLKLNIRILSCKKVLIKWKQSNGMWNAAEHLVVSLLYMFYIVVMSYSYYYSDDISILACEDEAHLAAFTENDEEFYMGLGPRNTYWFLFPVLLVRTSIWKLLACVFMFSQWVRLRFNFGKPYVSWGKIKVIQAVCIFYSYSKAAL